MGAEGSCREPGGEGAERSRAAGSCGRRPSQAGKRGGLQGSAGSYGRRVGPLLPGLGCGWVGPRGGTVRPASEGHGLFARSAGARRGCRRRRWGEARLCRAALLGDVVLCPAFPRGACNLPPLQVSRQPWAVVFTRQRWLSA